MGDILRRRGMMQAAGGSGPALPKLKQGTSSYSGRSTTISGGHIVDSNTNGNVGSRNMYIDGTTGQKEAITTAWFQLHAGDVVTIKSKNFSYTNYYTYGAAVYSFTLRDTSGNSIVSLQRSLPQGGSGSQTDAENSVTLAADTTVASFIFYAQRKSTVEYDLELWVNDVQYI